jgi:hypothetical protein
MTVSRYPLQWPESWPRSGSLKRAQFKNYRNKLSVVEGVRRVMVQLAHLRIAEADVVISTNVKTRLDGYPRSDQPEPSDHGAAVYWTDREGRQRVMALDRYDRVADNLAALAATLEALRAIERHGGGQILERAFTGFDALPAPTDWRRVLELDVPAAALDRDTIERAYRRLAAKRHPDVGGSHNAMAELNAARARALEVIP